MCQMHECVCLQIYVNFIYNICFMLNIDNEKCVFINMSNILIETQMYALVLTFLFSNIKS